MRLVFLVTILAAPVPRVATMRHPSGFPVRPGGDGTAARVAIGGLWSLGAPLMPVQPPS